MATYSIVEFRRDGLAGWIVESSAPIGTRRARVLYQTSDLAQAEADRLTATEPKDADPATSA
ncbi:MAG: hypothetical protein ACREEA_10870 [Stellaceae bacterium]